MSLRVTSKRGGHEASSLTESSDWIGTIWCYWYTYEGYAECDGDTYCYPSQTNAASTSSAVEQSNPASVLYCGNGCEIYDMEYYWCPGDGDEGEVDDGGSGGTEEEEPPPGCEAAVVDTIIMEYPNRMSDGAQLECGDFASDGGSPNFPWWELNDGWSGASQHPPWAMIRQVLLDGLEATRANYNRGGIRLSSGYRCPKGNALWNGVPGSYHTRGRAADMFSSSHAWTRAEFDLLREAARRTGPIELSQYDDYTDHHLHAAW
jgi:hypothetical protein